MPRTKILLILFLVIFAAACGQSDSASGADNHERHAEHEDRKDDKHESHDDEAGHGEGDDEDHDDHGHEDIVRLDAEAQEAAGIALAQAETAPLPQYLTLPAEIRLDPDRVANVSAPLSGIVQAIFAKEGDQVQNGQALIAIQSRELADLKADYLSTLSAERLAKAELDREETLWKQKVTSEASVLAARAAMASAKASREAAETKLHAIGLGHDVLDALGNIEDGGLARYELIAPLAGQVIRRNATLGEAVELGVSGSAPLFIIADMTQLWTDITVYKQDLGRLSLGAQVTLIDDQGTTLGEGKISFISPVIDEISRTATARFIVDNSNLNLRPGQFITARIDLGSTRDVTRVPDRAVQIVEGRTVVFVPEGNGFLARTVITGQRAGGFIEIRSGLRPGESYVSEGAFTLKAELEKAAFGDGHVH